MRGVHRGGASIVVVGSGKSGTAARRRRGAPERGPGRGAGCSLGAASLGEECGLGGGFSARRCLKSEPFTL